MKQIIITKPGVINSKDKAELTKSGIVLIEADNPNEVRVVSTEQLIPDDVFLHAALYGANEGMVGRERFTKKLYELMYPTKTTTNDKRTNN